MFLLSGIGRTGTDPGGVTLLAPVPGLGCGWPIGGAYPGGSGVSGGLKPGLTNPGTSSIGIYPTPHSFLSALVNALVIESRDPAEIRPCINNLRASFFIPAILRLSVDFFI